MSWDDRRELRDSKDQPWTAPLSDGPKITHGAIGDFQPTKVTPEDDADRDVPPPSRSDILLEAERLLSEEREAQYGDPHAFWAMVAAIWSARLGVGIHSATACSMMANVKQVRAQLGAPNPDNATDACGYEALAGEIALRGDR